MTDGLTDQLGTKLISNFITKCYYYERIYYYSIADKAIGIISREELNDI